MLKENKQSNRQELRQYKKKSNRGILYKKNKETETKKSDQVSELKYSYAYIGLRMCTHTSSLHMHVEACEHRRALENPNPESKNKN